MQEINFIYGKNIGTKNLKTDRVITCHFEIPKKTWEKMADKINNLMTLVVDHNGEKQEYDCFINTDSGIPIGFKDDHGILKLDIKILNPLLIGYISDSTLYLKY